MQRRLSAILAADMVGYSRLIAADEQETIARQKEHRAAFIDPKITQFGGRIVKTMGDGLLVEFSSAVDAVQCALEIQKGMPEREMDVGVDQRGVVRALHREHDLVVRVVELETAAQVGLQLALEAVDGLEDGDRRARRVRGQARDFPAAQSLRRRVRACWRRTCARCHGWCRNRRVARRAGS